MLTLALLRDSSDWHIYMDLYGKINDCFFENVAIYIPNRTFLVRFIGISGEFGRAIVRILARCCRAKIPMARPNEPDMPPKRTKKVRLGIFTVPKFAVSQSEANSTVLISYDIKSLT